MMKFTYRIKDSTGAIQEGNVEAVSEPAAIDILHGKGYVILSLQTVSTNLLSWDVGSFLNRPKTRDIVLFTRQFSTLLDADTPLAEGLRILAHQTGKPTMQRVIADVSVAVEGGSSFHAALANHPKIFTPFYVKLVNAGELSGKLNETLAYLADYLERSQAITSKIRGALAYPAFIVFAMAIVVIIMVTSVLPNLLEVFKTSGITDLPITTRLLISFTDIVNGQIVWLGLGALVIGASMAWFLSTPDGKNWADRAKIRMPLFGKVMRNLYLARISESLATLVRSDIAILDALRVAADLVGNHVYQEILLTTEERVRGGGGIASVLSESPDIPPLMSSMLAIGERVGKLEYMLDKVAKFYKTEAEESIGTIAQLIEPILILVLGFAVAVLVSAVLLPLYSLTGAA